jgi:hypothetical protein
VYGDEREGAKRKRPLIGYSLIVVAIAGMFLGGRLGVPALVEGIGFVALLGLLITGLALAGPHRSE